MGLRHKQSDQKSAAASLVLARARHDIGKALTPGQMKRLEQISLQELGAEALSRSNIVKALNLTQEQQQTLAEIRSETGRELSVMAQRFQEAFFPKWAQPPPRGSRRAGGDAPSQNQFAQGTASTTASATPGSAVTVRSASGGGGRSGGGTFILTPAQQKMMEEGRAQHQAVVQQSERRMIEQVLTPQQQAKLKELQGKPCPISLPGFPQTP
jgi:Spy/CpxP family protein refolding chaperone